MGSKSTNHGVHLPIGRQAFSHNQGLSCPSSSSFSSSSCCAYSVLTPLFRLFDATLSDDESNGPSPRCLCSDYVCSCPHRNSSARVHLSLYDVFIYKSVTNLNVTIVQPRNMNIMCKTSFIRSKFFIVHFALTKNCSLYFLCFLLCSLLKY